MSKLLEDGLSDDEPDMEIQIKTLMGTTIDIEVNSEQTVGDIKRKISRVEGIPVYQQNLIFRSGELRDASRLCDVGVRHGSVLTLVTSMRGGPISTRRLSLACEHHIVLKELKKLLENTRDEIAPGSKVSVLVFKEGDIINLLRVIENEDGSYSPYVEKPISPPNKPSRRESRSCVFERLVEDSQMSNKIAGLRKKMAEVSLRKQTKNAKEDEAPQPPFRNTNSLSFKFLSDRNDLKIFERTSEEDNQSETEEIALKDKHRTKPGRLPKTKSVYGESKGAYSHTKSNYTRTHKKKEAKTSFERDRKVIDEVEAGTSLAEQLTVLEEDSEELYGEAVSVSARNRVHLARLIFSEGSERPKSSPDSIELEENAQDLWEIHEPAAERLKHGATCKVGLLKRRQSVEYGYEGIGNAPNIKPEIGNCKNSGYGVCSGNLYMPQLVSAPSAIPPQYAPKDSGFCDYFISGTAPTRTPLYGRRTREEIPPQPPPPATEDCSTIQRLKNDCVEEAARGGGADDQEDVYGYYGLAAEVFDKTEGRRGEEEKRKEGGRGALPPVAEKKARCAECNRRLNITNIYNCRCGRIFCSQHRYSEVHHCSYNYKTEGRKILEQQNPLVTAEKVKRI